MAQINITVRWGGSCDGSGCSEKTMSMIASNFSCSLLFLLIISLDWNFPNGRTNFVHFNAVGASMLSLCSETAAFTKWAQREFCREKWILNVKCFVIIDLDWELYLLRAKNQTFVNQVSSLSVLILHQLCWVCLRLEHKQHTHTLFRCEANFRRRRRSQLRKENRNQRSVEFPNKQKNSLKQTKCENEWKRERRLRRRQQHQ